STTSGIDFDWLDKRSLDPVGYKRVNKRTGKEIDKENIVKGVKVEGGRYVVISEEEIKAAYPKTTQTIEIEGFVKAPEVLFTYLEAPYYLEPLPRGEKVYALLREAMLDAGVIGIARVVMHSKEHLAALVPTGPALMLNTLRWAEEIRPATGLKLPPEGKKETGLKEGELKMARQLVDDMTGRFEPEKYSDKFADAVHELIRQRVAAGDTAEVQPLEEAAGATPNNVVDLTELLARSLGKRKPSAADEAPATKAAPAKKAQAARKVAASRKRAA
ncbi:MAG TPA: Ku protein, partial [Rubrivivax sp.]|nr:Ku protein [Rubrivivax sp.]